MYQQLPTRCAGVVPVKQNHNATLDDRGQAYTLEGVIAAVIIASALVFGLQAVDIAPWSDQQRQTQADSLRTEIQDMLAAGADRDALRTAVTCVDGAGNPDGDVANPAANVTQFAPLLDRTLDTIGRTYVIRFQYLDGDGAVQHVSVTPERTPTSTQTVTATRQVMLFDSDPVHEVESAGGDQRCVPQDETLEERNDLYVPNQQGPGDAEINIYSVVRVQVIAW